MPKDLISKTKPSLTQTEQSLRTLYALTPNLRSLAKQLGEMCRAQRTEYLRGCWHIGEILNAELTGHPDNRRAQCVVEQIAEVAEIPFRQLWNYWHLFISLTSEEFEAFVALDLTFSHVLTLLDVIDSSKRMVLAQRASAEYWSCNELKNQVRAQQPNQRPGSGRQPGAPRSLATGLVQLEKRAATFERFLGVLFGEDFDLPESIRQIPPDRVSAETESQVTQCVETFTILAAHFRDYVDRLRGAERWVHKVLAKQRDAEQGDAAG